MKIFYSLIIGLLFFASDLVAQTDQLELLDVFELENVSDPQISSDGNRILYLRAFRDIKCDQTHTNIWMVNFDGSDNRPVTTGNQNDYSPRWSPDGKKVYFLSNKDGSTQVYAKWFDDGSEAKLTNFTETPGSLHLSPDGTRLAISMFVKGQSESLVTLPAKPAGAHWAEAPKYITKMTYRQDGQGYVREGFRHIFVVSTDGGTPRQLTDGDFDHGGQLSWTPDSQSILFSANRKENGEYDPRNSEVHRVRVSTGVITALTDRQGPDGSPVISPNGKKIAYLGFDDTYQGYQVTNLYVMNADGSSKKMIATNLDRDIANPQWSGDSKGIYFQYDDKGDTKIAMTSLAGKVQQIADQVGGLSLGRPYSGGTFTVSANDRIAFTLTSPSHPADLASVAKGATAKRLTDVNKDLFTYKAPGAVEEIWFKSSHDNRDVQGWICKPPNFDPNKKYPLILEIHGGPFANYGNRFSAEGQLYAAAGYVVLFTNPRGSTSYGAEFGNLIHHNYPGEDYDDLMSGVDAVIEKGYIDESNLFVTGGSGGGVLSSWIIGKTDRFRAAVVAKPVINWYSFVLYADGPAFFYKYWFPGYPWDHAEHYMKRSPISLVGNVTTPTMLLTGEVDYRTPISESEQYYAALQIQQVESAMVRIPEASHGIANRPSYLMSKVAYVLGWFEKYRDKGDEGVAMDR